MVITRSKARSRQILDCVASPGANPSGPTSVSNQNIPQQLSHEGDSSSTQDPGGCLTTSLAAGNKGSWQMLYRLFELSRSITFFRSKIKHNRKNFFFHKH